MLSYLQVENFVFIEQLALSFKTGMTSLTGETGAGKSILCDALWLALGETSDKTWIHPEKAYCRIEAHFDIRDSQLKEWLALCGYQNDVVHHSSCHIIRRLPQTGHAQVWINGKLAKISDLKFLKENLVARHSQHDQQCLLNPEYQRLCLDRYGGHTEIVQATEKCCAVYQGLKRKHQSLLEESARYKDKQALLAYQLAELEESQLSLQEVEVIEQKQRQLAHANQVLEQGQAALTLLSEDDSVNLYKLLQILQQVLHKIVDLDERFSSVYTTVTNASVDIQEADTVLRQTLHAVVVDPQELAAINEKLEQLYRLARKHQITVQELPQLERRLQQECKQYTDNQAEIQHTEQALQDCLNHYQSIAAKLSQARIDAARRLEQAVTEKIQPLGMQGGQFKIKLVPIVQKHSLKEPSAVGDERINFYLSATSNQSLKLLAKNASGGELSRLSLVIQTLIADNKTVPTLIFDEIDVGVGGIIAEKMGHLLKELSRRQQILCITHLPQIAVLAQHHYVIEKQVGAKSTITQVIPLQTVESRVQEIARMLGGIHLKDQTLAYAKSMLLSAENLEEQS